MYRAVALMLVVPMLLAPSASDAACGTCKAERVTAATASALLFGGSDAAGGIDDWYLSNGKVQAVVDDIGPAETGVPGVTVDKTSSNAVETGGTLIDVGVNGKNNDQLPQSFNVGGLSLANVFIFRQGDEMVWGLPAGNNPCAAPANPNCPLDPADADCAALTVYGVMLGACSPGSTICSTRTNPKMFVRTTYKACKGQSALNMRTELWNQSGNTQSLPVFDIFLWGGKGITPFAADRGRGFTHPSLDLSSTSALLAAFTSAPYFVAPGNVSELDGVISRRKKSGAIAYGYHSLGADIDSNGGTPGGTIAAVAGLDPNSSTGLQSPLLSAVTISLGLVVPSGQSVIYKRELLVAARNDVAGVAGSILAQAGLPLGTVKGRITPAPKQEGTITFVRTGGSDLSTFGTGLAPLNNAAISAVRAKSSFKDVQLPEGTYSARAVFAGRDDVIIPGITVAAGTTTIMTIPLAAVGKLKLTVADADTHKPIPAKISLSPSPSLGRDFAAFTYDVRTGVCSNNASTPCVNDSDCGAGNACFRTCTNVEPQACGAGCPGGFTCSDGLCRNHGCSSDSDCDAGYLCKASTTNNHPEGYPGGIGQLQVLYADKRGQIVAEVKPGTYTISVSRGIEYTIQKLDNVAISAGVTTTGSPVSLKRVVDTAGYMSADFHIHSGRSLDSAAPLEARVRSFAGEGLEVMVSTDHDIVTDYSPAIKKLGMNSFITSIIGTEVTTSVPRQPYISNGWGHINSWPSTYDPNQRRSGSVEDESVSLNVILDRLRNTANLICIGGKENGMGCPPSACPGGQCTDVGEQVVQMNHPRSSVTGVVNIGMYDNIGYDPSKAIDTCQKYPVICPTSECAGGTNDGTSCTADAACTGGGKCGCGSASIPAVANGCNDILNDLNVVPQSTRCTTAGCGSAFANLTGTRNVDFDTMEVENASKSSDLKFARRMRRDWLSFLNQGITVGKNGSRHPMWATGVSDSHRLVVELPGYARTFVGGGDFPAPKGVLDIKSFDQQILAGNMTVTAGPYVQFTVDNGGTPAKLGQTLSASGSVNLNINVQAAPWIPIDEVRIVKNGCVMQCFNSTTTPAVAANPSDPYDQTAASVVRFNATVPDTVNGDSYYVVEASPNLPPTGTEPTVDAVVNSVAEGNFPLGFTNPIFVDANGGGYTGIGLPAGAGEPTCPALPLSCSAGAALASAPVNTLYADGADSQTGPRAFLASLLHLLERPAVAGAATADADSEDERLRQHEQEIRKSADEYYPRHLVVLPTPRPEEVFPRPQAPIHP